jgi:hypothetical protein
MTKTITEYRIRLDYQDGDFSYIKNLANEPLALKNAKGYLKYPGVKSATVQSREVNEWADVTEKSTSVDGDRE